MAESKDYYGPRLLVYLFTLVVLLAYTSLYLIENFYPKAFLASPFEGKTVYILESDTLDKMYHMYDMDIEAYQQRLQVFSKLSKEEDFNTKRITVEGLSDLPEHAIVFALDMMALSDQENVQIQNFVAKGGRLLFNFTSGFLQADLSYRGDKLVSSITGLKLNQEYNSMKFDENMTAFISPRLLSPLSTYLQEGYTLDLGLYDPLPLFITPKNLKPDAYMTNWSQVNYIKSSPTQMLKEEESGLIWHGSHKKGKWVYFNFPSYVFINSRPELYAKLFKGMLRHLGQDLSLVPYPYIDSKNAVFVSEDTEFKYENLKQFNDISIKHQFPVTAFCVAELAKKHPNLMKECAKNPLMEIGSHSYTHKKIVGESDDRYQKETQGSKKLLSEITQRDIVGFRPPREEIDTTMIEHLQDSGYKYILSQNENRLSPYFMDETLIIPRHGTDDYSYLINLDWDASQILDEMITEVSLLSELDGIYAMSTHTHLMNFGSNISILDKFFAYVKAHKELTPLNGEALTQRVVQRKNISYTTKQTPKKFIIDLSNRNDTPVKNLKFTLFSAPDLNLINVESEMIGLDITLNKERENEYTLRVASLLPKSQTTLFINYESTP